MLEDEWEWKLTATNGIAVMCVWDLGFLLGFFVAIQQSYV